MRTRRTYTTVKGEELKERIRNTPGVGKIKNTRRKKLPRPKSKGWIEEVVDGLFFRLYERLQDSWQEVLSFQRTLLVCCVFFFCAASIVLLPRLFTWALLAVTSTPTTFWWLVVTAVTMFIVGLQVVLSVVFALYLFFRWATALRHAPVTT